GVSSLSPIVISSVVATVISRHHLGDFPAFNVPTYELVSSKELLLYGGLGIVAGVMGMMFIRLLYLVSDRIDASNVRPWMRPAIGGMVVGLIAIWLPQVYGVGYETINASLMGKASGLLLGAIMGAKLLATAFTLGSGGSGGIFAPSLFLGATLGATWGHMVHNLFPNWTAQPGAYALVGMGAFVSATTHAPITAILIIFEMTNDYHIIPPLMLTCVMALLISGRLHKESIYTAKLLRRGVRLSEGRDVNILKSINVHEVMTPDAPIIPESMTFSEFVPRLLAGQHPELLVVDSENRLVGSVGLDDIKMVIQESENLASLVVAADVVNEELPFVLPDDNMDVVMHMFGRIGSDQIPVCDSHENKKVIGMVTRAMVIEAYNTRIFHMDLPGGFHSLVETVKGGRMVEVLGGIHLTELEVPTRMVGKTLKEVNLRKNFNIEVVLIHTAEESNHT
ncbi:MAG: CBS domain-containing protein, partial [bacterium]|nr:CBS domain-containing protein [bacterium]